MVVLLFAAWRLFLKNLNWRILSTVSVGELCLITGLTLIAFMVNGYHYYYLAGLEHCKLRKRDILFLPLAMGLWGLLIPFQGAAAYQMWYFKRGYRITVCSSLAFSIFLYLFTVIFCGFVGVLYVVTHPGPTLIFGILSLVMLLSPVYIFLARIVLRKMEKRMPRFLLPLLQWFNQVVSLLTDLFSNPRLVLIFVGLFLLRLALMILIYWRIAVVLGYPDIGVWQLMLINLWNFLSLLIKLTPQNLGVTQLITGAIFAMLDLPPEQAVMMSLYFTVLATVMELTLGVAAHFILKASIPAEPPAPDAPSA